MGPGCRGKGLGFRGWGLGFRGVYWSGVSGVFGLRVPG